MTIQMRKVRPLFRKDIRDLSKNANCLIIAILPVLFTFLYKNMNFGGEGMPPEMVLTFGLLMNSALMPISVMAMSIAEEKEKNTLRTLMLSNVSAAEFLLSKFLMIFLVTQLINLVVYAIAGTELMPIVRFLLVTSCSIAPPILLGALVGILSKNQMSTGTLSAPLALLLLMPAIFGQIDEGIAKFARFTPTMAMMNLLNRQDEAMAVAVLIGWTILSAALFALAYRKKRLD